MRFGAIAFASGCSDLDTGGHRIELEIWLESALRPETEIENAHGWKIQLSRAELGIDHLYFVTGDPVGGSSSKSTSSWWGPKRAHAHPGHYSAGDTLGEMNQPVSIELLEGSRHLLTSEGVTGQIRSCVLRFLELEGEEAAVVFEGVARKDGTELEFSARVSLQALENSASDLPEVPGIPFERGDVHSDGRISFVMEPSVWLNQVDFGGARASEAEESASVLEPGTPPHNAFVRGIQKAVAYRAHFEEKS